jgi:hypothetical protein
MPFDSQLEASASVVLSPHGIVRASGLLPGVFYDANRCPFNAKADFVHIPTGVLFELKDAHLNGATTQAAAANKCRSSRSRGSARWRQIECGWNHAAAKLAHVQEGIATAGGALVALFWNEPDPATVKRLNTRGTFWVVYGSPAWRSLLGFLKLAGHGLPVSLTYRDDLGEPLHIFSSASGSGCGPTPQFL